MITISNKIIIGFEYSTYFQKFKDVLTLINPAYLTMMRQHNTKALYGLKKFFTYYEETNQGLKVGRGMLPQLLHHITDAKTNIKDERVSPALNKGALRPVQDFALRNYQTPALREVLVYEQGTIKLGTGYGKTIIALELARHLNTKALFIVPSESVLNQFISEAKRWYGYDIGVIQGSKWLLRDITVASVLTLQRRDLSAIVDNFGLVIADECHTMITAARLEVIQAFKSRYLYGMSATPARSDGQGNAIFYTFGPIISQHALPHAKPKVVAIKTECDIEVEEYGDMIANLVASVQRNDLIIRTANAELSNNRKILILVKRIVHGETIKDLLSTDCPHATVYNISSDTDKNARKELLLSLRSGVTQFDVIIGTYSMLSTGVDIPKLDTLIFAGDVKSDILTQQSAGRILRIFEGKKEPVIIDFVDNLNGILNRQAAIRRKFYKSMEWI